MLFHHPIVIWLVIDMNAQGIGIAEEKENLSLPLSLLGIVAI